MKNKFLTIAAFVLSFASYALSTPLPFGEPKEHGYSIERLGRLHDEIQSRIEAGQHAGAVSLIARNGNIVDWQTYGYRDKEQNDPMEKDDIFRIFSMSKVMTSVAALILFEEGKFLLDDPVSKFIPEMAEMKVYVSGEKDSLVLEDQKQPIRIKNLFNHTSGLPYDFSVEKPLKEIYSSYEEFAEETGEGFIRELVKKPLVHQPGERMTYGMSTDVLGRLVEVISGQTLGSFMQERIWEPLALYDTAFSVPESKLGRLVKVYTHDDDGLKPLVQDPENSGLAPPSGGVRLTGIESGGGGLYSTVADYVRFAQMLLNGGELDGVRILSRKTVELMTSNHLEGLEDPTHMFSSSEGFGLGVSVRISLSEGNSLGSVGQYGWTGAATTYYSADPKEKTIVLLFFQHMPYDQFGVFSYFNNLHYQALVD